MPGAQEGQEKVCWIPWNYSYEWLRVAMRVLENEPRSFGRATSALQSHGWLVLDMPRTLHEERTVSSIRGIGKNKSPYTEQWNWTLIISYCIKKNRTNVDERLSVTWSCKATGRKQRNVCNNGLGELLLVWTLKTQTTKAKVDKWGCISEQQRK